MPREKQIPHSLLIKGQISLRGAVIVQDYFFTKKEKTRIRQGKDGSKKGGPSRSSFKMK
jgi:hypothetical protein